MKFYCNSRTTIRLRQYSESGSFKLAPGLILDYKTRNSDICFFRFVQDNAKIDVKIECDGI